MKMVFDTSVIRLRYVLQLVKISTNQNYLMQYPSTIGESMSIQCYSLRCIYRRRRKEKLELKI